MTIQTSHVAASARRETPPQPGSALPGGTCAFPTWGDPKGPEYWLAIRTDIRTLQCGKPTMLRRARDGSLVSSPYCQEHHRCCFMPAREMRKQAA
jgi:hypothetical protein